MTTPTRGLRLLAAFCVFSALLASPSHASQQPTGDEGKEPITALLFAYFRTESETLHYAVSRDGLRWAPLNENQPVMTPTQGAASVRWVLCAVCIT